MSTSSQEAKTDAAATPPPPPSSSDQSQTEVKSDVDVKQLLEQNAKLAEDVTEFKVEYIDRDCSSQTDCSRIVTNVH